MTHQRRGLALHARQYQCGGEANALDIGTLIDTFTAFTIDGTAQVVTITINGTNDAPVAVADSNAGDAVIEAASIRATRRSRGSHRDRQCADQRHRCGQRRHQDGDRGQRLGVQCRSGADRNLRHGHDRGQRQLDLHAGQHRSGHQCPGAGADVTDVFTYTMSDTNGATSPRTLTITITGTNDAPVAVADTNAGDAVTESGVNPGNTPFPATVGHRQRADQRHRCGQR